MPFAVRSLLAAVLTVTAVPAFAADDIPAIQADLKSHSDAAKVAGGAGMRALAAGDKTTGCASLRTSEAEIVIVRGLLAKWREALMATGTSATETVMKQQKIDEMDGAWVSTQGQVRGAI